MKQKKNEFCSSKIYQESSKRAQPNWKTKLISCHTPVVESTRYADLALRIAEDFLRLKIRLSRELDEWFRFREYSSDFQISAASWRRQICVCCRTDPFNDYACGWSWISSYNSFISKKYSSDGFFDHFKIFFGIFLTIFQIKTERQMSFFAHKKFVVVDRLRSTCLVASFLMKFNRVDCLIRFNDLSHKRMSVSSLPW